MTKSLMSNQNLKSLGKDLIQRIVETSAGDIRSALNCASLVATQIQYNPKKRNDPNLYVSLSYSLFISLVTIIHEFQRRFSEKQGFSEIAKVLGAEMCD